MLIVVIVVVRAAQSLHLPISLSCHPALVIDISLSALVYTPQKVYVVVVVVAVAVTAPCVLFIFIK